MAGVFGTRDPRIAGPRPSTGSRYRDAANEATDAAAAGAREDLQDDIGTTFGNLQAIGALRSGATGEQINRNVRTFGDRVGRASSENALRAVEGEQAGELAREGMAAEESRFGRTFGENARQFNEDIGERRAGRTSDEAYRTGRASRSDTEYDRSAAAREGEFSRDFGERVAGRRSDENYRTGRASRSDLEYDRSQSESSRRYNQDFGRQSERDRRADEESNRDFTESGRRFGVDTDYRRDRATRGDFESDRGFGYGRERDTIGDQRYTQESERDQRRYEQERNDQIRAERARRRSSIWGSLGSIAGAVGGFALGGPAGAGLGSKIGGLIGGRRRSSGQYAYAGD